MNKLRKMAMGRMGWFFTWLFILLFAATATKAQSSLTIDECYRLATKNYPLVKQRSLVEKAQQYSVENAAKGFLPQFSINGQGTYQSEVTALKIPNVNTPILSKDQYRIYGEMYQSLTDHATVRQQKELAKLNGATEQQRIEVELYKLRERINQLFFGLLLIDAQMEQVALLQKDVRAGIDRVNAGIANGTALKTDASILRAELLKSEQRMIELRSNRAAYAEMLAVFINQPVEKIEKYQLPAALQVSADINRPELRLFDMQKRSYDIQNKLITARNLPKAGVFFQGGYGRPGLNQLSNDFSAYYIGGVKLSWNLASLYTVKNDRRLLKINQQSLDVQKETFLFNTGLSLRQQHSEISRYQQLIDTDQEIIDLREKVKSTAKVQLENGTITTSTYLEYVNAEDQARQNLLQHKVQLGLAQYNHQTTTGN